MQFLKELGWTIFWVFLILIIGYAVFGWAARSGWPVISQIGSFVDSRAQPQ